MPKSSAKSQKPPFFIIGCPRSGTTIFQTLIDSHPNICIPPESSIFAYFGRFLTSETLDLSDFEAKRELAQCILDNHRIKSWNLDIKIEELCAQRITTSRAFVDRLFNIFTLCQGKSRWGEKTPQHAFHIDEILAVYPDAQFIHLIRDGRDVAESTIRIHIGPKSMYSIAKRWKLYLNTIKAQATKLPRKQYLEVKYEDVATQPQDTLARVIEFIGERAFDLADYAANSTSKSLYKEMGIESHASASQPLNTSKISIYKRNLTARQVAQFESIAGALLQAKGYHLEADSSISRRGIARTHDIYQDHIYRHLRKLFSAEGRKMLNAQIVDKYQQIIASRRLSKYL